MPHKEDESAVVRNQAWGGVAEGSGTAGTGGTWSISKRVKFNGVEPCMFTSCLFLRRVSPCSSIGRC